MEDGDGQGTFILEIPKKRRNNQIARIMRFDFYTRME
jgi:hypothetical protein